MKELDCSLFHHEIVKRAVKVMITTVKGHLESCAAFFVDAHVQGHDHNFRSTVCGSGFMEMTCRVHVHAAHQISRRS